MPTGTYAKSVSALAYTNHWRMKMITSRIVVEVLKNERNKWFWRLKSKFNGRVLADSKEYSRLQSCEKTALMLACELKVGYQIIE